MTLIWVKMPPSPCVSAISLNLIKKATIPFYTPNSITTKTTNLTSKKKIMNKSTNSLPDKSNLISLLAANLLLVHDQTIPPEIPGENNPPEFPSNPDINYPSSFPPEVPEFPNIPEIETSPPEVITQPPNTPEIPTTGPPEYPFPPLPTPPDIPLPPPGTPPPQPPDRLPPRFPPDPDILPPPTHPPPDIQPPPDIKPPPGPYVSFAF